MADDAAPTDRLAALYRLEAGGNLPPEHQQALDRLRVGGGLPAVQIGMDDPTFDAAEQRYSLPPGMLRAVAGVESSGNATAVSKTGVTGLMQVTLATGAPYGLTKTNRTNPYLSIDVAARHLADLLKEANGDPRGALALYGDHNEAGYADKVLSRWKSAPTGPAVPSGPGVAAAAAPPAAPTAAAPVAEPQGPPTAGGVMGDLIAAQPPNDRPFWTRIPAIAGAVTGASKGARVPGPWPVKLLGGVGGAALGGGGAEFLQALIEGKTGGSIEPGRTPMERGTEAAIMSGASELVGGVPVGLLRYIGGAIKPGMRAAADLGDVVKQALTIGKGGITAIRAADGTMRSLPQVLADPAFLASLGGPHASALPTLARAWWQTAAEQGPQGFTQAWKALGKKGQATMFGPMVDDVAQVVETIGGGGRSSLRGSITGMGVPSYFLGGPKVAAAMTAADLTRNLALPALFSRAVLSPTLAPAMTSAVRGADFLLPPAAVAGRTALQSGGEALLAAEQGQRSRTRKKRP